MRILAIETASEACSVALFGEGGDLLARDHKVIGRGHAEMLVPMISALPGKGRAERILVSLGPGSFTGVRIGLATARALGIAWGAQVLGYPTLALIAAMVRAGNVGSGVTICMNGGHGEWFVAQFTAQGLPQGEVASITPNAALSLASQPIVAGNRAEEWAAQRGGEPLQAITLLPDASHVLTMPRQLFSENLAPIYGRGPDATPLAQAAAT